MTNKFAGIRRVTDEELAEAQLIMEAETWFPPDHDGPPEMEVPGESG